MKRIKVVIGTRGSKLALWQADHVRGALAEVRDGISVEIRTIRTTGDAAPHIPLSKLGLKGLFTKEIEQALLDGTIDMAVHSLKDLPTVLPPGLALGAVMKREDAHDVFIAHPRRTVGSVDRLPAGATIATGSLRRTCQLLRWRPDLRIADLRGNVNTRLSMLDRSDWEGIILAKAGVVRLGVAERITETIPFDRMLPAPGQGALAIEVRDGDDRVLDLVKRLSDENTSASTAGERALLRALEGGCQVPIGAYGRIEKGQFCLDAMIGSPDGRRIIRGASHGEPARSESLGEELAGALLRSGGKELLELARSTEPHEVHDA